ncbi:glycoside hydrolase family 97 protein [Sphingobacterium sp. FBM7-1]|uniref:glycoside hydrolase family 97 protein n=1 Tax=Sphingobacterium sp. FBM7-1 TaxID=2886688 RepID=UPI001D122202|nr:glycoside hydrolase family 97 protein [Sphingobacterium sp. FBM7-1]MCC2598463.1 glycoside hydrolase family 97 protein [Sphingobacterium sp. FBM7-1]
MKRNFIASVLLLLSLSGVKAQQMSMVSPDNDLSVLLELDKGKLYYSVAFDGQEMLEKSPLGLQTHIGDLANGLRLIDNQTRLVNEHYEEPKIKRKSVHYQANEHRFTFETKDSRLLEVIFQVSNNNIAFRYGIPQTGEPANVIVEKEWTGFDFPAVTTTFLTPQATPMIGWKKTKPSYEEEYVPDEAIGTPSVYGIGYTFPALFRVGDRGWVLVSETGVGSQYCGSKLSEGTADGLYQISFPEAGENNGLGSALPGLGLPGYTPWRTITVGRDLKPIVETTIAFDVVKPLYEPSQDYQFGRSTWSWLEWQDGSINFEDQKIFIDLSANMGWEFALVDNWWDSKIGRDKVEELVQYGRDKGVGICLWYNSNGFWNDAPQGPKNRMNTAVARKQEMAWMQRIGVKGIKVDFFGGDKQETMKLYEDILSDANDHGLVVIFHGCTLPRGWERMYPNFVGSEAVLASENLIFTQHANDTEAYNATLHPFIRNTVASMDFGPVLLNKRHNRENNGGTIRKTSETFQLATAVLFQTPVQNFGITPNNLHEFPDFVIDFMKEVPTVWDETVFIDGYPGKYVVLARRQGDTWYIAGINAEKNTKDVVVSLPMLSGNQAVHYWDDAKLNPNQGSLKINNNKTVKLTLQSNGAVIIVGK